MARFNKTLPKQRTLTENLAGGEAYKASNELALVSLLLTSFVNDQFYRSSGDTLKELKSLMSKIDNKEFIAKSAIFARDKFGMRSITHALAAELTSEIGGQEWGKEFYNKVVGRVDDMSEILSYYIDFKTDKKNPKFPNALKKGFAKAFDKFDNYQLSKYKSENKEVKLVDIVNIVHPNPTERNSDALRQLVKNELKSTGTWEAKLSQAGQDASSKEELAQLKTDAWSSLIKERKIGYFALLRNLRNILTQSPELINDACELLTDERMIKKSKVLPFRFTTAYDEISKVGSSKDVRTILMAINKAIEISVDNVPSFEGETLVVLDTSLSMRNAKVAEIASLFASILVKKNNCDILSFDRDARYLGYNPMDSLVTIRDGFNFTGTGTNFKSIFQTANKKYDRIIILSDMQGWIGYRSPSGEFNQYKSKFDANPFVYSLDLAGYGTLQLPENNVFALAGFSDKVFDIMSLMESDKRALYNEINEISL